MAKKQRMAGAIGNKTWIVLFIALIISTIFVISTFFYSYEDLGNPGYDDGITRFNELEKANGIVTNIWIHETSRLDTLKEKNIKYLFVDIGDTDSKGKIDTDPKEIEKFLRFVESYEREKEYDFILLPYSEVNTQVYEINSFEFQFNFVDSYVNLAEQGFDGVLIDIEYVPKEEQKSYLKILDLFSEKLDDNSIISAYVSGIDDNPNYWSWSPEFLEAVAKRVDLIEFGSYDTEIENLEEYQEHVREQIKKVTEKQWDSNFLFTAPTHKSSPETLRNSLEVYKEEIGKSGEGPFIGIAIFAEWTTDNSEWETFGKYI